MVINSETQKFKEFIEECAGERVEQVDGMLMTTERYKTVNKQKSQIFNQLRNALTDEGTILLGDYEEKENELRAVQQDFFYNHGFTDAIMIMKAFFLGGFN